jgi:hypothetical protein
MSTHNSLGLLPMASATARSERIIQAAADAAELEGVLQAEYRGYVVFTSRDDNEEIDEWTVGFTYFF